MTKATVNAAFKAWLEAKEDEAKLWPMSAAQYFPAAARVDRLFAKANQLLGFLSSSERDSVKQLQDMYEAKLNRDIRASMKAKADDSDPNH
jgi:hypothetical protein